MSAFLENENGHVWHERVFSSMQIKCCMNCGFIKNEQQPNKPCPGPVFVGLRSDNPHSSAKPAALDTAAVTPSLDPAASEGADIAFGSLGQFNADFNQGEDNV